MEKLKLLNAVSVAYREAVENFEHLDKNELKELWEKWLNSAVMEF